MNPILTQIAPYLKQLNLHEADRLKAESALTALAGVDAMLDAFFQNETKSKGETLLTVYGFLQGLFVGIDGLYDLAISLTSYKYHININANHTLRQLKFIRNDIVGHPTNRVYDGGAVGFSVIDFNSLTSDSFDYQTCIFTPDAPTKTKVTHCQLKEYFDSYHQEKDIVLKELLNFLVLDHPDQNLIERIRVYQEKYDSSVLQDLKNIFRQSYGLSTDSNRFLWRVDLVKSASDWYSKEKDTLHKYLLDFQINKLLEISSNLKKIPHQPKLSLPPVLVKYYRFIRKDETTLLPLIQDFHDANSAFRSFCLTQLIRKTIDQDLLNLFTYFGTLTDETQIFLLGSVLKNYLN